MNDSPPGERTKALGAGFGMLVLAVLLIGINQRPAITVIPPVQDIIAADIGMGTALTGALTSIPLVCFALFGLLMPALTRRFGVNVLMLGGLVLLTVSIAARPWAGVLVLFAGTLLVGSAITILNVLVPVVVRRDAPPGKVGLLMPMATATLSLGAALASFVAVDAERLVGWRWTIALIAVPAAVTVVVWIVRMRAVPEAHRGTSVVGAMQTLAPSVPRRSPWADPAAWWLAAFFGIQSGLFYATAAWLPSIVGARADAGRAEGGYALTLYFLFGILGSMTLPLIVRWVGSYRRASAIPGAFWVVAYLGLIAAPGAWAVWSTLAGIGQGIGIGLCLTLVAVRPIDAVHGRGVSSMVQSAAYTIAAAAPVVFGWLFDASGGWLAGCILGVGLAVAQTIAGFPASSAKPIGAPREPVGGR